MNRFRCRACGRRFSEQTFSLDYYVKRRLDYHAVSHLLCSCVGVRAAARVMGCSANSVSNRTSRLARQCISAHARLITGLKLSEDQVADGFQSFAVSQYFPNNIHLLVGSRSQLVSFCDYVSHRRSGRMSTTQRRMRTGLESLYRPSPQALIDSFSELLEHLCARLPADSPTPLVLHTDAKLEYRRAVRRHRGLHLHSELGRFLHQRTDSRAARTASNPLFPVNYLDRELRKDLAEHVRETVRFARNVNNSMERLWIYLYEHNTAKRYRINDPTGLKRTHAQIAGVTQASRERAARNLLTRRRFLSFERLEAAQLRVWRREHRTPLEGVVKGALRLLRRQAIHGEVDLDAIRRTLQVRHLVRTTRQCLPAYTLA